MNYQKAAAPFVKEKLIGANEAFSLDNNELGFKSLEDAHVLGQYSTYWHTLAHIEMLKYGWKQRDLKEVSGQVFRIIGALTKTAIGLLPDGNTGGANVSPFKSIPISVENKTTLEKIKNALS